MGLGYEPLFPYFAKRNAFVVLDADFVEEGEGTGIVHIAPGFGEDDFELCRKHDIDIVCPVDSAGKFTDEVADFTGKQVFDANDPIIIYLKERGFWHRTEQYLHNYPHCWRTDTPLIYKAVSSWYVKVTAIKDRMVELNQQINWIPGHIKDGLFGKWLENARDWSISRNRFFGTPLPVWKSDDPRYPRIDIYGSIQELERDFGVPVHDLHRPFIDTLVRPNPDDPTGKSMMRRVEDIFDCWFESGSMPYGQAHYPFENKEWFERNFPADFIVEYSAQTRGWFYTLMVLSVALFDRPPFLNCICHGVILDGKGQKLSKRLNNYQDPMEVFSQYGADALRAAMLSSAVVRGQELLMDTSLIYDALRLQVKPMWNAYSFFTLYANADGLEAKIAYDSQNVLDLYILNKMHYAITEIRASMDAYDISAAYARVTDFFECLNNWYIRRSRARFWAHEKSQDKQSAYDTLFTCLEHMCRAAASLFPLITESIYRGLGHKGSVHLVGFPEVHDVALDGTMVAEMDMARKVCTAALSIRNAKNIRIRQPLASLTVVTRGHVSNGQFDDLIRDELNVKQVTYVDDIRDYAKEKLEIVFASVGKRLPRHTKEIVAALKAGAWQVAKDGLHIAGQVLLPEEFRLSLEPLDQEAGVAFEDGIVALDTRLTQGLLREGYARDLVRFVQQMRKDAGLVITDRIAIGITAPKEVMDLLMEYGDFIKEQTLATSITGSLEEFVREQECSLDAYQVKLQIRKCR